MANVTEECKGCLAAFVCKENYESFNCQRCCDVIEQKLDEEKTKYYDESEFDNAIDEALENQEEDLKYFYEEKENGLKKEIDTFLKNMGVLPVPDGMDITEYLNMYAVDDIKKGFNKTNMIEK